MSVFALFESCRALVEATSGRAAFIGEAEGAPELPYAVLSADWDPEPDIGQELLSLPGASRASIQINCYGRANSDALWLDSAIYTLLTKEDQTFIGTRVLWRDADDSPVLSRSDGGHIISKHWYRFVYAAE